MQVIMGRGVRSPLRQAKLLLREHEKSCSTLVMA